MVKHFRKYNGLHIWLIAASVAVLLFYISRGNRFFANFLVDNVTSPVKQGLARAFSWISFSVAELLIIFFALATVFLAARQIWRLVKYPEKKSTAYRTLCGGLCVALSVYAGLCWLYGINYYADSFQEKSGIYAAGSTAETLYELTAHFAEQASEAGELVKRDEDGLFAAETGALLAEGAAVYDTIQEEFTFLALEDVSPKGLGMSRLMSYTKFTGFYSPFTGEANVNMDIPICMLPAVIAHEMAHQRNVASEDEANFVAVLACISSDSPDFIYSGYLFGYRYLSSALYGADRDLWQEARGLLSEGCLTDLAYNNAYWSRFSSTAVSRVTSDIYDTFLKSNGEISGVKSYGEVVDLLTAYFCGDDRIASFMEKR